MNQILADLFRHNRWANQQVLDTCAGLSQEQLDTGDPGAYGTIAETLTHLVAGEELYVWLLTRQASPMPLRESAGFPGMAELKRRSTASGETLVELARHAEPGQTVPEVRDDVPEDYPVEFLLIQSIDHGREHRTNVTTILARLGVTPPEIDGWAFLSELGNR